MFIKLIEVKETVAKKSVTRCYNNKKEASDLKTALSSEGEKHRKEEAF